MKPFAVAAALASWLTAAGASGFEPPQVFKNANLVHVVSLEKNYVKEAINVQVENIDKSPQDEYFVPIPSEQIPRIGGFEVKDRKNQDSGPLAVNLVEADPESDVQYYRIQLPSPLEPGAQQTLGISYNILKAYTPLPAAIKQDEKQYLSYEFNAYAPSVYPTTKQKTDVKTGGSIQEYTQIDEGNPSKSSNKLTYGPFHDTLAGATKPSQVRFEFTKPVLHVSSLQRDVEVSHWGGNVAFEERYDLTHLGANLSDQFNRVKWAQSAYYNPATAALKELKFPLQEGSIDPYYTDVIGNVSTSRFRSGKREAILEAKPRYPVFGGWRYPFTIGWNSDAKNFLRKATGDGYVLNIPFLEGPKQAEGIEYESIQVRVLLPEGATNVKFYTTIPTTSILSHSIDLSNTFLDTLGRTVLAINATNLVDDMRDRELIVTYDSSLIDSLRKPLLVFTSMFTIFVVAYIVGGVEVKISSKK
ncbi:uncharacterized protein MKZ38_002406 [Zalerion maritima]|uniref:Dolichyl-diphosphooligosaccharide--protein glycosyltransferase subunit 1 n=1 Tax=Zalerion maritima TaxID=339359 RepID=A0AAD5RVR0_9PEZI|nr:uncharacterized protein MKZ38_002406 [Zalerion maritima]